MKKLITPYKGGTCQISPAGRKVYKEILIAIAEHN